jgi:SAM-dependent methyltransferase
MAAAVDRSAEYFDGWYADMVGSPVKDEILQRHLGLPPELLSTSLLTWDGLAEVVETLSLPASGVLVDLACGRGGYGVEIARRTGARVIGVDFSEEALKQARVQAGDGGVQADYHCADLTATGLPDRCADAVLCVDAIQFAAEPAAAYGEIRRLLRPGGRVALTGWEAVDRKDDQVPQRLRRVDMAHGLAAAGFADIDVQIKPAWRAVERALWEEAAALDPCDDPALQSLHEEGVSSLGMFDRVQRVLAVARG